MSSSSSSASRACSSLRSASGREPALVAPPEVHARPVDRVARRRGGDSLEHREPIDPPVSTTCGAACVVEEVEHLRDEPCRHGARRGAVGVDDDPPLVRHACASVAPSACAEPREPSVITSP